MTKQTIVQRLADRLKQPPELVLLIDGIGATLSAFFLGVALPALERYVGMPRRVLFGLALVALSYGACSIGAFYLRRPEWRAWLRVISTLNLAYCGVTAALVAAFWGRLTVVGVTYFLFEILIIVALARLGWPAKVFGQAFIPNGNSLSAGNARRVIGVSVPSLVDHPDSPRLRVLLSTTRWLYINSQRRTCWISCSGRSPMPRGATFWCGSWTPTRR